MVSESHGTTVENEGAGVNSTSIDPPRTTVAWARITQRVKLLRVGGQRPTALFASKYDGEFSLSVSTARARELGAHLYHALDIEARVLRGTDGAIERGELLAWHPLTDDEAATAWRDWFHENALSVAEYEREGQ